jgi:Cof subfamily protein (haloacid dehalogenase superfamily)
VSAVTAYDVVALDLDGTTVRSDGTIGERTQAALRRVEDSGCTVIAVTGRPPRWMPPILDALGPEGLAICANGAVVLDVATRAVVEQRLLEVDVVRRLVAELTTQLPDLRFGVELADDDGFAHEPGYQPSWDVGVREMRSREDLFTRPAVKLLARSAALDADALLARARQVIGAEVATLTHSSQEGLLEISAAGVTKATTLADLCARRGTEPSRVIAFGDMPNDVPMLTWAGRAVAVANAHPEVLAVADEVTLSNDEDGVAVVLERLWS